MGAVRRVLLFSRLPLCRGLDLFQVSYSCQQVREMIHQTPLRVSVHNISLRVGVSEGDSSSHHPEGMLVHVALAKVGRELCLCFQLSGTFGTALSGF